MSNEVNQLFPHAPVLSNDDGSYLLCWHHSQPWESLSALGMPPIIYHICNQETAGVWIFSHPGNMTQEREMPSLNDCGHKQSTGSSLDFHVGDEIRPPVVTDTSEAFPAKGIDSLIFLLRQCIGSWSIEKYWSHLSVLQSDSFQQVQGSMALRSYTRFQNWY